jgi:small subunit ribosomal protein S17
VAEEKKNEETTEETPAEEAAPEAQVSDEVAAAEETPAAEEAPAEEPAADVPAEAAEEAPATETEEAEAPAEEAAPQPAAEVKKKRKRLPRSQRHTHSKPVREKPAERKAIVRTPRPQPERGRRQERRGVVVSSAMDKTIVVKVDTIKSHPRYKKVVRRSVKFHAHDEQNSANVGDVVRIVETRPLSKTKHWKLVEVVEAAR